MKVYSQQLVLLTIIVLIVGCAVKPEPHNNKTDFRLREAYQATHDIGELEMADSLLELFDDDNLDKIISTTLENNYSIKQAVKNLELAGISVDIAESPLLPSLNVSLSPSRSRSAPKNYSNRYSVSFDSRWEVDIWGKIKTQVSSAEVLEQKQKENLELIKQSTVAQAVQAYFSAINAQNIAKIYKDEYKSFKQTELTITEQFSLGLSNGNDLDTARASLYSALQNKEQFKKQKRDTKKQLNIFMGKYPDNKVIVNKNYPKITKSLEAGIPADIIQLRPDIKSAYLDIVRADKDALISYKDMFPKLTLTASLGRASNQLNSLSHGSLNVWSLVGGLAQPLFDRDLRKNRLKQNVIAADIAYDNYQKVILDALFEVEKYLDAENSLKNQLKFAKKALKASISTERRAVENYSNGVGNIFDLLTARRGKYSSMRSMENLKLQYYNNRVSLALALGKAK